MIITIDGPSGTGKSTVARKIAEKLGVTYFDTGALYRAFTWFLIAHHVNFQDKKTVGEFLKKFHFKIEEKTQGSLKEKRYFVNEGDVTEVIRSRLVTSSVSEVSALKEVRTSLLHLQQDFAKKQNTVMEGRDLGTVVFPQADLKIFLTADPSVRAERRLKELLEKHPVDAKGLNREEMLKEITKRDEYDSTREVAPLKCPKDAVVIDTTQLSIEEVVNQIVDLFTQWKRLHEATD